jgi:PEP-CTERM motif-containing protein
MRWKLVTRAVDRAVVCRWSFDNRLQNRKRALGRYSLIEASSSKPRQAAMLFKPSTLRALGLSDLVSVTIAGVGVYPTTQLAVDNIVVTGGAVPEPATWAEMLLGFASLGFAVYRQAMGYHTNHEASTE